TKELPEQNRSLKYKVLLLMDEFTAMGRSAIIAKSNNYFAGYGLQLITIVQNPAHTKELPEQNRSLKYKVLLLMDEFTAMGRSAIIAKSNNYFAGYGLQLITIVQNPAQIRANEPEGYGQNTATTFIGNHEAQLIYTPEKEDAEEMSKFLGDKTVKVESEQRTTGKSGKTITVSEQRRALMLPQELREMPFEKMIIMMRGRKAIYGDKIHYYQESPFIDRLKALSPSLGQIKGIPTKAQLDDAIAAKELQIT
ncbi:type IV secretory system conjugative DNA transfer family protein, partial [Vibrio parahaemolyticus]|uniref:type IV secretory system conjugative DNA transfer family protein n=1 Tax=Vibrio parahaemolyticus TaxID=670 RepID=UPI00192A18A9